MAEAEKVIAFFNAEGGAPLRDREGTGRRLRLDAHGQAISEPDMARAQAAGAVLLGGGRRPEMGQRAL